MKHKDLVDKAKQWLSYSKSCNPVFTEKGSANNNEFPDAIGWHTDDCLIVECKTSKEDFKRDFKKDFRFNGKGLGKYRYYLMTQEIYEQVKNDIPSGWGILILDYNAVVRQERFKGSDEFVSNIIAERNFLRSRILEIQRFGR